MTDLDQVCQEWREAKEAERRAVEARREAEDRMIAMLGVSESMEGTSSTDAEQHRIKVTGRMNRKVDTEALREAAAANGLEDHLDALFRWRAEINLSAWKHAAPEITNPLASAITTKPGRPSFSIEPKEDADNG
jgi:hypothetical protein